MKKEIEIFQGLRGWAILLVFLSHCEYLVNVDGVNKLRAFGGAGVSVCILLSGFLAARKLIGLNVTSLSGIATYCKRWKQFYILHFITLLLALPLSYKLLQTDFSRWFITLLANATLTQTLVPFSSVYFSFNAVSWFLSIIMIFALLTPISVKIWKSLNCTHVFLFMVCVNLLQFLLCYFAEGTKFEHWLVYINPLVRYLDFLLGGFVYILSNTLFADIQLKQSRCFMRLFFWLPVVLFAFILSFSTVFNSEYFATAIWTIPTSIIILSTYIGGGTEEYPYVLKFLFKGSLVQAFGNISLAFFMIHQLLIRYLTTIARRVFLVTDQWFTIFCVYVCAFIVGCCFAVVYDKLCLTKRNY